MPYTRAQLLEALRTDHPEFRNVDDNKLFAALAVDHPDVAKGISDIQGGDPSGKPSIVPWYAGYFSQGNDSSRTAGQVASDQAAHVLGNLPDAITSLPNTIWETLKGKGPQMIGDMLKGGGSMVSTPVKQGIELAKPGLVNAPTPDAPETAAAASGAGALLGSTLIPAAAEVPQVRALAGKVGAPIGTVFDQMKAKMKPLTTSPGLTAVDINKWMDVPASEVTRGANPGQQLLDEKLLGQTKEATKASVKAALDHAGKQMEAKLQAAQNVQIDAQAPVYDAAAKAVKKIGRPREASFQANVDGIVDDIESRYPNLNKLTPEAAHKLKVELGDSIRWKGAAYDEPINQVMVEIYKQLNDAIKTEVPGIEATQKRWGNLYIASKNLAESMADDLVGKGTGSELPPQQPSPLAKAAKIGVKHVLPHAGSAALGYGIYREFSGR